MRENVLQSGGIGGHSQKGVKPKSIPKGAITCTAAAKMFGITPHELVRYCRQGLKNYQRGVLKYVMPEDVRAWRVEHTKAAALARGAKESPVGEGGGGDINAETPMDRLLQIERAAFSDYTAARKLVPPNMMAIRGAMAAYGVIAKIVTEAQRRDAYIAEIKSQWWADVATSIVKWSEPILAVVQQMPRSLAQRLNPSDPAAAESVLADFRDKTLLVAMSKQIDKPVEKA